MRQWLLCAAALLLVEPVNAQPAAQDESGAREVVQCVASRVGASAVGSEPASKIAAEIADRCSEFAKLPPCPDDIRSQCVELQREYRANMYERLRSQTYELILLVRQASGPGG